MEVISFLPPLSFSIPVSCHVIPYFGKLYSFLSHTLIALNTLVDYHRCSRREREEIWTKKETGTNNALSKFLSTLSERISLGEIKDNINVMLSSAKSRPYQISLSFISARKWEKWGGTSSTGEYERIPRNDYPEKFFQDMFPSNMTCQITASKSSFFPISLPHSMSSSTWVKILDLALDCWRVAQEMAKS